MKFIFPVIILIEIRLNRIKKLGKLWIDTTSKIIASLQWIIRNTDPSLLKCFQIRPDTTSNSRDIVAQRKKIILNRVNCLSHPISLTPVSKRYDRRWFVGKTWYNLSREKYRSISDGSIRNFSSRESYGFALWIRFELSLLPALFFFFEKITGCKTCRYLQNCLNFWRPILFYNVVRTHVRPFSILYARVMIERYVDSVWTVLLILRVHNTPRVLLDGEILNPPPLPRFVNIGEEKKLKKRRRRIERYASGRVIWILVSESIRSKNYTYVSRTECIIINRNREESGAGRRITLGKKTLETMGLL